MLSLQVKRTRRPSAWVNPRKYRKGYGCVPMNTSAFNSDDAKTHTRFIAVSDWGYVCKWITDCTLDEFEFIAWLYLRDQLDTGLKWKVMVRWPRTDGLLEQNQLSFKLRFSAKELQEFLKEEKKREAFRAAVHGWYNHFWRCFYVYKWCTTRSELIRWIGEYTFNTEWIKTKLPGQPVHPLGILPSRRPLKLKLPSTCLLLAQSGRTSRYVCLGYPSSDSTCQTFMSSSPTERAFILKQKGTSTPRLG